MAILNYFPVGASEIELLRQHPNILPAVICATGSTIGEPYWRIMNDYSIVRLLYSTEPSHLEDSLLLLPMREFYVEPNVRSGGGQISSLEGIWVKLSPGHTYQIYRKVYHTGDPYYEPAEFYIKRDNTDTVYTSDTSPTALYKPAYNDEFFYWSNTEPEE